MQDAGGWWLIKERSATPPEDLTPVVHGLRGSRDLPCNEDR